MTEKNGHKMEIKEAEARSIDGSLSHEEEERVPKGGLRVEGSPSAFDASTRRKRKRRRWLCGCCLSCGAVVIVLAIIILVLALTVFKAKEPKISINSVTIDGLSTSGDLATLTLHVNLTVTSELSIKNTNKAASFKHGNGTAFILYDGKTVGQAAIPPGNLKADRTARMNVSATVFVDVIVSDPLELIGDIFKGSLNMTSRAEMAGRVNVLHLIKKHVKVFSVCDITVDLSSERAEVQHCKDSFKL